MNKKNLIIILTVMLSSILLSACGGSSVQSDENSSNKDKGSEEETNRDDETNQNNDNEGSTNNQNDIVSDENTSEDSSEAHASNSLSKYSAKEIEYARVWLQITGNKETEELNVEHISAGAPVNPYDDNSVNFPEDVISLGGKIMADGIVTYSGNGDGTINLYNVPSHWPSYNQLDMSMKEYTEDIIENTKQIYIETGDDNEVSKLIEKIEKKSTDNTSTNRDHQGFEIDTDTPEKDQKKAISLVRDFMSNTYDDFVEDENNFLAYDGEIKGHVIIRYATLFSGHTSTNGRYAVDLQSGKIKGLSDDIQDIEKLEPLN